MSAASALTPFGFTALESEIYAFLLEHSPATGYRVAQAIGKPVANTYKAIESLESKGAILVDTDGNRLCRAVAFDELLARLSREFEQQRRTAQEAFSRLGKVAPDDRIYGLKSTELALQRARTMLSEAGHVALLATSATQVEGLRSALEAASARGVDVAIRTTADVVLEGAEVVVGTAVIGDQVHLSLVVDGEQALLATLLEDEATGFWTRNPLLVASQHHALAAQQCLVSLASRIDEGSGPKRLAKTLATLRKLP